MVVDVTNHVNQENKSNSILKSRTETERLFEPSNFRVTPIRQDHSYYLIFFPKPLKNSAP